MYAQLLFIKIRHNAETAIRPAAQARKQRAQKRTHCARSERRFTGIAKAQGKHNPLKASAMQGIEQNMLHQPGQIAGHGAVLLFFMPLSLVRSESQRKRIVSTHQRIIPAHMHTQCANGK